MAAMTLRTTHDVLDAVEHLPEGATLVVPHFGWDDYERLLVELAERPHFRVSYDCGRLEIMSPLPEHEIYIRFIEDLVRFFCVEHDVALEKLGQTTWKSKALAKGVEPDACYYVQNAKRIFGKFLIDLAQDPPPDIVVEIDTTNDSSRKFVIYAALSVPEIWRYDGHRFQFFELSGDEYVETAVSRTLPGLTGPLMAALCANVAETLSPS